jgi:hypothetical protein
MALFLRCSVTAVALCMLLFCISCEKHPLGQMPEVQREQRDPATRDWSEKTEMDKAEAAPHEAR